MPGPPMYRCASAKRRVAPAATTLSLSSSNIHGEHFAQFACCGDFHLDKEFVTDSFPFSCRPKATLCSDPVAVMTRRTEKVRYSFD